MGLFSNLTELFKKITDSVEEAELENLKVSDADTLDASGPEGQNPLIQDSFQTSYPLHDCLLYTSPSPRDATLSRMPSSA